METLLNTHDIYIELDRRFRNPEVTVFKVHSSTVTRIDDLHSQFLYSQFLNCQMLPFKYQMGPFGPRDHYESFTMSVLYDETDVEDFNNTGLFVKEAYRTNVILRLDNFQLKRALDTLYKKNWLLQNHNKIKMYQDEYKYVITMMKNILKRYGQ